MGKIRNFVIVLAIIITILIVSTKSLLWYYTNKTAQNIQNTLPKGMFSYTDISTSLTGSASIDNITLTIIDQTIKIQKIELQSKNIFDFLKLAVKSGDGTIPDQLTLKIQGISISLSSLLNNKQIANHTYPLNIPCGKVTAIGLAEYIKMGYHQITFDIDINYQKLFQHHINITTNLNAPDFSNISLTYQGDTSITNPITATNQQLSNTTIPDLTLHISNNTFQRKLYNFCATQENKKLADYLTSFDPNPKQQIDQATTTAFGLTLSNDIINALNDYDKDPKEFYLAIKPKGGISFNQIKTMHEKLALNLLRPILKINGKNIPIAFKWTTSQQPTPNTTTAPTPTKKPVIESTERIKTPINQLNNTAFNKNIEIYTTSGRVYKGVFRKVDNNLLYLSMQKKYGFAELAFDTAIIKVVYVLADY